MDLLTDYLEDLSERAIETIVNRLILKNKRMSFMPKCDVEGLKIFLINILILSV